MMRRVEDFGMTATPASSYIRTFAPEDIPQVADLHRRVFGGADQTSPELLDAYRTYFTDVYLRNAWLDEAGGALVHQEKSGKITRFLALMPRPMGFKGRTLEARVTFPIFVGPGYPGSEAAGPPGAAKSFWRGSGLRDAPGLLIRSRKKTVDPNGT